jgi:hypothetical protein
MRSHADSHRIIDSLHVCDGMQGVVGIAATHPRASAVAAPGMHRSAPLQNTWSLQSESCMHRRAPSSVVPSNRASVWPSIAASCVLDPLPHPIAKRPKHHATLDALRHDFVANRPI